MLDPVQWFRFPAYCNGIVPVVWLAHEWNVPDLRGNDGLTYSEDLTVFINVLATEFTQDYVVFHESLHCGARGTAWLSAQAEERVVRKTTSGVWPTLRRLGFRWPARPEGYEALRREARRFAAKAAKLAAT